MEQSSEVAIQTWLQKTTEQFTAVSKTARIDAEALLLYALKMPRVFIYSHGDTVLSKALLDRLEQQCIQRLSGMPIAYILSEKEFWSMTFYVSPDVLIPRPETEHLVEIILAKLDGNTSHTILELGTGSGAIAIAIAKERPDWRIVATDNSQAALRIAQKNAIHLLPASDHLSFQYSHWFEQIPPKKFSAIISNPPYIATNDSHLEKLQHEPSCALLSGTDGLDDIQIIITQSIHYLEPNGWLFLEHGNTQAAMIIALFQSMHFTDIQTYQDLAQHDRVTCGRLAGLTASII